MSENYCLFMVSLFKLKHNIPKQPFLIIYFDGTLNYIKKTLVVIWIVFFYLAYICQNNEYCKNFIIFCTGQTSQKCTVFIRI